MATSKYEFIEHYANDWSKYLDPNTGCYFFWNTITKESSWTKPKKIFTESDQKILPVDLFLNEERNSQQDSYQTSRKLSDSLQRKCRKCNGENDVLEHNYCQACYQEINAPEDPLLHKYKIKCKGCHGWGLGLVQSNGYCNHCTTSIKQLKPISSYENLQSKKIIRETPFPRCSRCGGWGKDLLQPNGMCNYCIMMQEEEAFDIKWKTKCRMCGGWGMDLVKFDGFCNHCRRISQLTSLEEGNSSLLKRKINALYENY